MRVVLYLLIFSLTLSLCSKKDKAPTIESTKPKADFTYTYKHQGNVPDTVNFTSTSTDATSLTWYFENGTTSTLNNPTTIYTNVGTYLVKLTASNQYGIDSITKPITIHLNRPAANFTFTITNPEILPVQLTTKNTSTGSNVTYKWSFGNGTSLQTNPTNFYNTGGLYNIKLVATNDGGSDSITKELKISPYPQAYKTFYDAQTTLNAWEGKYVMILSRNSNLNRETMFKWLRAMDGTYEYYKLCTGREPILFKPHYYINDRTTIADVTNTCGAGCGYLGWTGIELQNNTFDGMYNGILNRNQYDQAVFYEFGRNFWFYGNQLAYKSLDPVTTGFAIFMRFMSINTVGVNGGPFGNLSYTEFQNKIIEQVDLYMANPSLNWSNTLAAGKGVPGGFGGSGDLFASFCFRLRRDYGGETFVQNFWKKAALQPNATTTQDAVDNFFLAACATANKNLTNQFNLWRWPLSDKAKNSALNFP